nr:carbamoyltransferase HypF [Corynebacterium lactis]
MRRLRREFFDPADRRYLYPFISCTNCGPRLSIIEELPYDRPRTTMRVFPMCAPCESEYTEPADRRFHAQPISCFDCGPRLSLVEPGAGAASASGGTREEVLALFARVHALLDDGAILAVKGIGGFHLVCDARDDKAVARLRSRKRRPDKPLAVMVPDVVAAREIVALGHAGKELLASPEAPIVIAAKRVAAGGALAEGMLSEGIAPGLGHFGVMLPYSGIHLLLCDRPLVVTSGNISGEPVCTGNEEALAKLGRIADAFVLHDRDIHVPVEDSVFVGTSPSRRSRGFAPLPIPVSARGGGAAGVAGPAGSDLPTVFATGGELKNTFALAHEDLVHVSAHIGDMGSWASQQAWHRAADQLLSMRDAVPDLVVCDLHPGYATTSFSERFADERGIDVIGVQHHWAHALSLLAEHRLLAPGSSPADSQAAAASSVARGAPVAVVAALDGTGYGTDGTVWGGEILEVSLTSPDWRRAWHFPTFPLVGGDRAVTHPWRLALGLTRAWGLDSLADSLHDALTAPDSFGPGSPSAAEIDLVEGQLSAGPGGGIGTVPCSSLGRIFDAAAALILPRWCSGAAISYEAQAAMELEAAATEYAATHPEILEDSGPDAGISENPGLTRATEPAGIAAVIARAAGMPDPGAAAFEFHRGVAGVVAKHLVEAAKRAGGGADGGTVDGSGTDLVGVTGGCANNALLMRLLEAEVARRGYRLLQHRSVPPGDGGLSLGQAMAGRLLSCGDSLQRQFLT